MKYRVVHTTKYVYSEAVPVCHNLVHLAPRELPHQACGRFQLVIQPEPLEIFHREDFFGNRISYFSIDQSHRALSVTANSSIDVFLPPAIAAAPSSWENVAQQLASRRSPEALRIKQFIFPSTHTQPFATLRKYAQESFRPSAPILQAVLDLTARIHDDFTYDPKATTVQTPIEEVFEQRHGVCQDFAHLQIACLRSIGLAARYVSGYLRTEPPPNEERLVGADASHAWLSVYCGKSGWVDVDPTNNIRVGTDHITVAWGLDYDDVCPVQGVVVGGGEHRMNVSVDVEEVGS